MKMCFWIIFPWKFWENSGKLLKKFQEVFGSEVKILENSWRIYENFWKILAILDSKVQNFYKILENLWQFLENEQNLKITKFIWKSSEKPQILALFLRIRNFIFYSLISNSDSLVHICFKQKSLSVESPRA